MRLPTRRNQKRQTASAIYRMSAVQLRALNTVRLQFDTAFDTMRRAPETSGTRYLGIITCRQCTWAAIRFYIVRASILAAYLMLDSNLVATRKTNI